MCRMPGRGGTQGTDMREFPANKFENISGQHVFLWKDILGQPAVALTPALVPGPVACPGVPSRGYRELFRRPSSVCAGWMCRL